MSEPASMRGPADAAPIRAAASGTVRPGAPDRPRGGNSADEEFIRALYAEHGPALYTFTLNLTNGDRQHAEDLVQETILRAWRHPDAIGGRPARPWLFAVARNLAIDKFRARQARPPEMGEAPLAFAATSDAADQVVLSLVVTEAFATLRPDHRRVLTEIYYRGRTATDAATLIGIPIGTVKSRTYYALKALKLALEERGITLGDLPPGPVPPRTLRGRPAPPPGLDAPRPPIQLSVA